MGSDLFDRYDAIVVGARCAGAATAMLLARGGIKVLALDRHDYGSDTLSTHALMRGAVIQLHRWGLLDAVRKAGTPAVTTTVFHYGDEDVLVLIKPGGGVDALYAPRRTVLDRLLVDGARQAGADIRHGQTVFDLMREDGGRVSGVIVKAQNGELQSIRADLVVGADGLRSSVARIVGAPTYRQGVHAAAAVYGYFIGLDRDRYHWYFGEGVAASVIPTNDDAGCVGISLPPELFMSEIRSDLTAGFQRVLKKVSSRLAAAVAGAQPAGPLRAFAGVSGFIRRPCGPGWALIGDAGYFKDPITAHGITDAFRDAELLARAIEHGSAEAWQHYESERDVLSGDLFDATDTLSSFAWDLDTIRPLHRRLNEAMKREVAAITAFDESANGLAA